MATALMTLVAIATASAKEKQPDLAELVNKLKVGTHEGSVMLSLHYTQAEINRSIDSAKMAWLGIGPKPAAGTATAKAAPEKKPTVAGGEDTPGATAGTSIATVAAANAKPAPGAFVVRIFNADGGTREVPLARD